MALFHRLVLFTHSLFYNAGMNHRTYIGNGSFLNLFATLPTRMPLLIHSFVPLSPPRAPLPNKLNAALFTEL